MTMTDAEEKQPLLTSDNSLTVSRKSYNDARNSQTDAKGEKEKEFKDSKKPESATFGQLFRTADCLDVFFMIVGSLASAVHGAGWPVLMIFFGDMTDTFVKAPNINTTALPVNTTAPPISYDEFNKEMTKYALYYVYIGAAVFGASYLQSGLWTAACERQVHRIRKQFFRAILRQEIGWFDVHHSGELTTRLADDLERVREGLGDKFSFAIQFVAQFCAGFAIGFWKGWKLALVMMSLTPLLAIGGAFMSKMLANYSKREQDTYADAGSVAEEVLSCIRTVTSFNGQNQDLKR